MEKVGIIKAVFVASDKAKKIKGIFIFLEDPTEQLLPLMKEIFDDPKLKSETSSDGQSLWTKIFWKKNDISLFLDKPKQSKFTKISITQCSIEEKIPGINIE